MTFSKFIALAILLRITAVTQAMDLKGIAIGVPWDAKAFDKYLGWDTKPTGNAVDDALARHCSKNGCFGFTGIGPTIGEISIDQKDGIVSSIRITFPAQFFEEVSEALKKKFGTPSGKSHSADQNAFGAKFDNVQLIWFKDGQRLLAERYFDIHRSWINLEIPQPKSQDGSL